LKTIAAVLVEPGHPLEIGEIEIPPLQRGQVLVEVSYSGICHTQLLETRGFRGEDRFLPHCLGHEGSGVVVETGPGVSRVRRDDKAILSWIKANGADVPGTKYRWGSTTVNAGAITTFSHHAVISENRITPISDSLPMDQMALVGCAVPTGAGAVFNTAGARPGQSIAIFGVGGIGMCAVAAAAVAQCSRIIAVDLRPTQLEICRRLGATDLVNAGACDAVSEIKRIAPGGVDIAIEATGRPQVMAQALGCVRNQGGTAVVIGNAHHGESITLDPHEFNLGKRLLGTWGGDNQPDRDFPRYVKLVGEKRIPVENMMSRSYRLEEINQALDNLEAGREARPLIAFASN